MVLDPHRWLELRRFRGLYESGAMSLREIAKETGLNRRTVTKYLAGQAPIAPPKRDGRGAAAAAGGGRGRAADRRDAPG